MEFEDQLSSGNSGASATTPTQCSGLKVGGHVMIQSHPCKIANMVTSKPGKHGSTKVHIVAFDIFTGKRYEDIAPSSKMLSVPVLKKTEHIVTNVDSEGRISVLDSAGGISGSLEIAPVSQAKYPDPLAMMEKAFDNDLDLLAQVLEFNGEGKVIEMRTKAP